MKLLMQFSPTSCHFSPLQTKYSLQHLFSNTTNDLLENEKRMKFGMIEEVKGVHGFSFWYDSCCSASYQCKFFIIL
jgi:hypothetical protein